MYRKKTWSGVTDVTPGMLEFKWSSIVTMEWVNARDAEVSMVMDKPSGMEKFLEDRSAHENG